MADSPKLPAPSPPNSAHRMQQEPEEPNDAIDASCLDDATIEELGLWGTTFDRFMLWQANGFFDDDDEFSSA
jgi:hypothetical protein